MQKTRKCKELGSAKARKRKNAAASTCSGGVPDQIGLRLRLLDTEHLLGTEQGTTEDRELAGVPEEGQVAFRLLPALAFLFVNDAVRRRHQIEKFHHDPPQVRPFFSE